jgi:heme oxygenase (biliverdin-IX-beta and delta-forming)
MLTNVPNKVLPLLRNATAALHKQLDESLPLAAVQPTIEDYSQHLLMFKNWLSEIENLTAKSNFFNGEFSITNSVALKLLGRDLQVLGVEVLSPAPPKESGYSAGTAYCLGVEYVVRGSALGTAMLHKKVAQLFPEAPIEFMSDAMEFGKDRWKQFLVKLESYAWTEEDLSMAQKGSIWAFQQYIKLYKQSTQNQ